MNNNPIIIIEDDKEDCDFLMGALDAMSLQNKVKCFTSGLSALQYFQTTNERTFLIISDINMPIMSGLELKRQMNLDEALKFIPFVFLTTSIAPFTIEQAFSLNIQGFFQKPNSISGLTVTTKSIIDYWKTSKLPKTIN